MKTFRLSILFFVIIAVAIAASHADVCETIGGPSQQQKCRFPFHFGGKTYEKCTDDGGKGDFWCATETDTSSGEILLGKWGYCSDTCARYDQCGKPATSAPTARILGGSGVVDHSQPWVAKLGSWPEGQCTGTLISDRHILTAAHCELFVNPPVATLGDNDPKKVEIGEVTPKIKTVTKHPLYWLEEDTAGYDFAIWTLEEKVRFSKTIQPVCLPSSANESYAGSEVINSGWGKNSWKVGDTEAHVDYENLVLNTINLTTFPMTECKSSKWLSDKLNKITTPGRDLNETMTVCAGVSPSSVTDKWIGCAHGDSGGPLTVKDSESGVSTIIGVACDGPKTWEQYRTGPYCTYSRVSAVLPWIHETMKTT